MLEQSFYIRHYPFLLPPINLRSSTALHIRPPATTSAIHIIEPRHSTVRPDTHPSALTSPFRKHFISSRGWHTGLREAHDGSLEISLRFGVRHFLPRSVESVSQILRVKPWRYVELVCLIETRC